MYILAHDSGTNGNKATLFDEPGLLIVSHTAAYPTDYVSGNRAEQNPYDWQKAIVDTTQALLRLVSSADIAGMALSRQMTGCFRADKSGRPLRSCMFYYDQRSQEEEMIPSEKIDPLYFYEITRHRVSIPYSIEKPMWVKKHEPEAFMQMAKMLNAKDYISYRLCDTLAIDPFDVPGINTYDLNRRQRSEEVIGAAGLDPFLFPDVRSSTDVIGKVADEAARETGPLAGIPVICGGGDGSCAGVGIGCVVPGGVCNYLGFSSWVTFAVEKPIVDEQRHIMNWAHVAPGMLHPLGTVQTAGSSHNWMINQLCQHEQALAIQSSCNVFELIDEQIPSSPVGANKLLFLPCMLGERTPRWNVDAKGTFVGLTLGYQHGDMLRVVMEGITLNLGLIVNIFRQHVPIDQVTVIGGCAQNPTWRQMMADIYQAEICVPNCLEEATSMRVAILAGIGADVLKDLSVIDRLVRTGQTAQPIPENRAKYEA